MTLRCECGSPDETLQNEIAATLRAVTKLGGGVELMTPGSLPNDGKVAVAKLGGDVELTAPGSLPNDGKVIADERG